MSQCKKPFFSLYVYSVLSIGFFFFSPSPYWRFCVAPAPSSRSRSSSSSLYIYTTRIYSIYMYIYVRIEKYVCMTVVLFILSSLCIHRLYDIFPLFVSVCAYDDGRPTDREPQTIFKAQFIRISIANAPRRHHLYSVSLENYQKTIVVRAYMDVLRVWVPCVGALAFREGRTGAATAIRWHGPKSLRNLNSFHH